MFVIAEIGINWDGDFDVLHNMMKNAKTAGCSAVKLQAFNENTTKNHPLRDRLLRSAVDHQNIDAINDLAKDASVEWFATPMFAKAVDMLDPYVSRFKIRELDGRSVVGNAESEIFDKIMKTGKEVIISTEISPVKCVHYDNPATKWLYCVPKYPCDPADVDFSNLAAYDGYSNHVPNVSVPLEAARLGAEILEVHVTLDKQSDFIDNNVSLGPKDFEQLVNGIRDMDRV